MPRPLDQWPLILCGPMLRRVTNRSVSVWLALKNPQHVTLRVYKVDATYDGKGNMSGGRPAPLLIGKRETARLGDKLHVVCVTAVPARSGDLLQPGELYCYDIEITAPGIPGSNEYDHNLGTNRLLDARGAGIRTQLPLGYRVGLLPRFSLPPADLNHLRIFHGSCLKPHAPGSTALPLLDNLLDEVITRPPAEQARDRPHQFFLTGDQIYADDVALALLHELRQACITLLGWTESVPGTDRSDPNRSQPITHSDLDPGRRTPVVRQSSVKKRRKFTSGYQRSHLIALGEYYAMYLFVWSNELWPEALPSMTEVFGGELIDANGKLTDYGEVYHLRTRVPRHEVRELAQGYIKEKPKLTEYMLAVSAVRRLLANVPSYMIFDDHEVTDDWFINKGWIEANLDPANLLSRHILINGLAAYALFQAWGNVPEDFETGAGRDLLGAAAAWDGRAESLGQFNNIARCVGIDHMGYAVGIGTQPTAPRLNYDYALQWASHRVIVLDTRTHRGHSADDKRHAELLSEDALTKQIKDRLVPDPNARITIIVSPAPVLGLRLMEELIQPMVELIDVFYADAEAWGLNKTAFQRLLRALAAMPRLVILSGDVHYGMTARCEFWDDRADRRAVFAQLTASALKNEEFKTHVLHTVGNIPPSGITAEFFAWENATGNMRLLENPLDAPPGGDLRLKPLVLSGKHFLAAGAEADWRYRLEYKSDRRRRRLIAEPPPLASQPSATDWRSALGIYQGYSAFHKELLEKKAFGRQIVGNNNLGEVTFEGGTSSTAPPSKVIHRLWWQLPGQAPGPLTRHEVDLIQTGPRPTHLVIR